MHYFVIRFPKFYSRFFVNCILLNFPKSNFISTEDFLENYDFDVLSSSLAVVFLSIVDDCCFCYYTSHVTFQCPLANEPQHPNWMFWFT